MMEDSNDPDGVSALKQQLLTIKNDKESTAKHIVLLRGKLQHLIERTSSPPPRIVAQIKIYAEMKPEFFRDDPECCQLLKDLLRTIRTAVRRANSSQSGDSSVGLAVLAARTLHTVYSNEKHWPLELLELYMEDSMCSRQWVDSPETSVFTRNLVYWTTIKASNHSVAKTTPVVNPAATAAVFIDLTVPAAVSFTATGIIQVHSESESKIEGEDSEGEEMDIPGPPSDPDGDDDKVKSGDKSDKSDDDNDGDSSGDEEILEDSAHTETFTSSSAPSSSSVSISSTAESSQTVTVSPIKSPQKSNNSRSIATAGDKSNTENKRDLLILSRSVSDENENESVTEEISIIENKSDVYDRFSVNRTLAIDLVLEQLSLKLGPKNVTLGVTSTWTILSTVGSLCGLSEVRTLAAQCLDRWLLNPAIGDHVKNLLVRIVDCLEVQVDSVVDYDRSKIINTRNNDNNNNSSSGSSSSGNSRKSVSTSQPPSNSNDNPSEHVTTVLIESDMNVVREIVKLRSSQLKPSQLILYKNTLIAITRKGSGVAKLVMTSLILADFQSGSAVTRGIGETVKFLVEILNSYVFPVNFHNFRDKEKAKGKEKSERIKSETDSDPIDVINENVSTDLRKIRDKKQFIGSMIGEVVSEVIYTMITWNIDSNSSNYSTTSHTTSHTTSSSSHTIDSINPSYWTSPLSKLLVHLLGKVLRSLDGRTMDLDFKQILDGVLGPVELMISAVTVYRQKHEKNDHNNDNNDNSNTNINLNQDNRLHPIEWEITLFYSDVAIALQLAIANEIHQIDKESRDRQAQLNPSPTGGSPGTGLISTVGVSGSGINIPGAVNTGVSVTVAVGSSGGSSGSVAGGGGGRGGAGGSTSAVAVAGRGSASIRGRGGGRGSSIPIGTSSMFRSGTNRATNSGVGGGRGMGGMGGIKQIANNNSSLPLSTPTATSSMLIPQGKVENIMTRESVVEAERRGNNDRDRLSVQILGVQELACRWLADLLVALSRINSSQSELVCVRNDDAEQEKDIGGLGGRDSYGYGYGQNESLYQSQSSRSGSFDGTNPNSSSNSNSNDLNSNNNSGGSSGIGGGGSGSGSGKCIASLCLEWIQRVCCFNQPAITRIVLDVDRSVPYYIRDTGLVSTELLRTIVSVLLSTATTTTHMLCGVTVLDLIVQRGLKSKRPGGQCGVIVTDIEIIPELLALTQLRPIATTPTASHSTQGSTRPLPLFPLPIIAHKELYWRVTALCFVLGCSRPDSLGLYLWTSYPCVKSLMLMAISSRFSSLIEMPSDECVGTKDSDTQIITTTNANTTVTQSLSGSIKQLEMRQSGIIEVSPSPSIPVSSNINSDIKIWKHTDTNGIDLIVSRSSVIARHGRRCEVESAYKSLEGVIWSYLFGPVPPRPVKENKENIVDEEIEKFVPGKRARTTVQEDAEVLREEKEKQEEKRGRERGARADRAAARLQRESVPVPVSVPVPLSLSSGVIEISTPLVTIPAHSVTAASAPSSSTSGSGSMTSDDNSILGALLMLGGRSGDATKGIEEVEEEEVGRKESRERRGDDDSDHTAKRRKISDSGVDISSGTSSVEVAVIGVVAVTVTTTDSTSDVTVLSMPMPTLVIIPTIITMCVPSLTHSSYGPYTTQLGFIEREEVMISRSSNVPRAPPEYLIKSVQMLAIKYGFGSKLRSCTDPDFISRAISGDTETKSSSDAPYLSVTGGSGSGSGNDVKGSNSQHTSGLKSVSGSVSVEGSGREIESERERGSPLTANRLAVEDSSSWLIPAIAEDADKILKRIPSIACLHLLLLSTLKVYNNLNAYGIWDQVSTSKLIVAADEVKIIVPSMSVTDQTNNRCEVDRENILYFGDTEDLATSLLSSTEHSSDMKFLSALVNKIGPLFQIQSLDSTDSKNSTSSTNSSDRTCVPDNSTGNRIEVIELFTTLLSDLCSVRAERRAAVRLVLYFLNNTTPTVSASDLTTPTTTVPITESITANVHDLTSDSMEVDIDSASDNLVDSRSPSPSVVMQPQSGDRVPDRKGDRVAVALQYAFTVGPSQLDFESFLIKNSKLTSSSSRPDSFTLPSTSTSSSSSSVPPSPELTVPALHTAGQNQSMKQPMQLMKQSMQCRVVEALQSASIVETDPYVLVRLLSAAAKVTQLLNQSQNQSQIQSSADKAVDKREMNNKEKGGMDNKVMDMDNEDRLTVISGSGVNNCENTSLTSSSSTSTSSVGTVAVGILLQIYLSRPLTAKQLISTLILKENRNQLLDIMSDEIKNIVSLDSSSGSSSDTNKCQYKYQSFKYGEEVTLTQSVADGGGSIVVSSDILKLILYLTLNMINYDRQSINYTNTNSNSTYMNTDRENHTCTQLFIKCTAVILSTANAKYSKIALLPTVSDFLCSTGTNAGSGSGSGSGTDSEDHAGEQSPGSATQLKSCSLYRSIFATISPLKLLYILSTAGSDKGGIVSVSGGGSGGGEVSMLPSGISVDCLLAVVESIDMALIATMTSSSSEQNLNTVASTPTPTLPLSLPLHPIEGMKEGMSILSTASVSASENVVGVTDKTAAWNNLIKPLNAKKILRIQCELQPLVLYIITTTKLLATSVNQKIDTEAGSKTDSKVDHDEEETVNEIQKVNTKKSGDFGLESRSTDLRSWALQSITLSHLFTLKELQTEESQSLEPIIVDLSEDLSQSQDLGYDLSLSQDQGVGQGQGLVLDLSQSQSQGEGPIQESESLDPDVMVVVDERAEKSVLSDVEVHDTSHTSHTSQTISSSPSKSVDDVDIGTKDKKIIESLVSGDILTALQLCKEVISLIIYKVILKRRSTSISTTDVDVDVDVDVDNTGEEDRDGDEFNAMTPEEEETTDVILANWAWKLFNKILLLRGNNCGTNLYRNTSVSVVAVNILSSALLDCNRENALILLSLTLCLPSTTSVSTFVKVTSVANKTESEESDKSVYHIDKINEDKDGQNCAITNSAVKCSERKMRRVWQLSVLCLCPLLNRTRDRALTVFQRTLTVYKSMCKYKIDGTILFVLLRQLLSLLWEDIQHIRGEKLSYQISVCTDSTNSTNSTCHEKVLENAANLKRTILKVLPLISDYIECLKKNSADEDSSTLSKDIYEESSPHSDNRVNSNSHPNSNSNLELDLEMETDTDSEFFEFYDDSRLLGNAFTLSLPSHNKGIMDLHSRNFNFFEKKISGEHVLSDRLNAMEMIPERNILITETEQLLQNILASEKNYQICWPNLSFNHQS